MFKHDKLETPGTGNQPKHLLNDCDRNTQDPDWSLVPAAVRTPAPLSGELHLLGLQDRDQDSQLKGNYLKKCLQTCFCSLWKMKWSPVPNCNLTCMVYKILLLLWNFFEIQRDYISIISANHRRHMYHVEKKMLRKNRITWIHRKVTPACAKGRERHWHHQKPLNWMKASMQHATAELQTIPEGEAPSGSEPNLRQSSSTQNFDSIKIYLICQRPRRYRASSESCRRKMVAHTGRGQWWLSRRESANLGRKLSGARSTHL